jgi:hypothetical protein
MARLKREKKNYFLNLKTSAIALTKTSTFISKGKIRENKVHIITD